MYCNYKNSLSRSTRPAKSRLRAFAGLFYFIFILGTLQYWAVINCWVFWGVSEIVSNPKILIVSSKPVAPPVWPPIRRVSDGVRWEILIYHSYDRVRHYYRFSRAVKPTIFSRPRARLFVGRRVQRESGHGPRKHIASARKRHQKPVNAPSLRLCARFLEPAINSCLFRVWK